MPAELNHAWGVDDHSVLLDTQAEIVAALTRELPADYRKDDLRNLLDRIGNDIDRNRSLRKAAASPGE